MSERPTKYYSTRQEKRIADYLGWSAVSASGARPFNPGDIKSGDWLCECKTHTKETEKITINKKVWLKICNEARSSFKRPILFVDNGTQEIKNTWCILAEKFASEVTLWHPDPNSLLKETETGITFNHKAMQKLLSDNPEADAVAISVCGQSLLLMKMERFKDHLDTM